jgi:hypothetical protein
MNIRTSFVSLTEAVNGPRYIDIVATPCLLMDCVFKTVAQDNFTVRFPQRSSAQC